MEFTGKVWKDGKFWLAEVPSLDLLTQGTSRKNAIRMLIGAVEDLVHKPGFKAGAFDFVNEEIVIVGSDTSAMVALMLKRQREMAGMTLMQVAKKLGSNSANAYAAYEQGKRSPSTDKLDKLLGALGSNAPTLRVGYGLKRA